MKKYGLVPIFLLVMASLAACGGRSPQPKYYLLEEVQPITAPLQKNGPTVALHRVSLPSYLDRDALVLRSAGAVRISVAEYHLWAEPLSKSVPRLLEETMRPLLQEKGLSLLWADAANAALQVDVDLLRMDGAPGGAAGIGARWRILGREGILLAQGLFTREVDAGDNYESMVRALSGLLADFARELAQASGNASGLLTEKNRGGPGEKGN